MKAQHSHFASRPLLSALVASLSLLSIQSGWTADAAPLVADQPILIPDAHGKFDFIEIDPNLPGCWRRIRETRPSTFSTKIPES